MDCNAIKSETGAINTFKSIFRTVFNYFIYLNSFFFSKVNSWYNLENVNTIAKQCLPNHLNLIFKQVLLQDECLENDIC